MYITPGIDWETLVYIGTLHIFTILSVCMPDNNLSYENGLNARSLILLIKSNSDLENFDFIYKNYTY